CNAPHKRPVLDVVEACLDVRLEHPLVVASRSSKKADLADCILSTTIRPKAVRTRQEVSLKDRLKHQRQGCLYHPIGSGRYTETADLAAGLGDRLFPNPGGTIASSLERA